MYGDAPDGGDWRVLGIPPCSPLEPKGRAGAARRPAWRRRRTDQGPGWRTQPRRPPSPSLQARPEQPRTCGPRSPVHGHVLPSRLLRPLRPQEAGQGQGQARSTPRAHGKLRRDRWAPMGRPRPAPAVLLSEHSSQHSDPASGTAPSRREPGVCSGAGTNGQTRALPGLHSQRLVPEPCAPACLPGNQGMHVVGQGAPGPGGQTGAALSTRPRAQPTARGAGKAGLR